MGDCEIPNYDISPPPTCCDTARAIVEAMYCDPLDKFSSRERQLADIATAMLRSRFKFCPTCGKQLTGEKP